ncbi:chromosome segregation protein SMC [Gloeobacter violaceus]|uniref:Chromosome partition protein Smc n=1 Tax=Gloeobacter violaceus (strain ATCC 29082 / PCC 7421) TaxID=251221 RepID=SMC_GLOVI|nr:chromosome segregation protein SMC [Gloeobacter violaceus]Q7NG51.1 RecName: Full=Chromosome partition protein Smc [Gloeobacter violaceus PCC 7421]BAC91263.1 glr3322 [Gloeobacter violaceus PCC 7421]
MHLKCLEIERFKSFGPYTRIPLLEGFTVVSGPNGSGKSNIIDALLFALGLSTSRGMRAEKLSDLIHQGAAKGEVAVTVTFALDAAAGGGELTVCRRLKVNGPNSTSSYQLNGSPCTLTDLHEELARHHIYPEGYNVVLQGDVTGIIAMPARERREIIDELAGVAEFDRKIEAARRELGEVEVRSDRIQAVVSELLEQMERLQKERAKAEEYRKLRAELGELALWEHLLSVRSLEAQIAQITSQLAAAEAVLAGFDREAEALAERCEQALDELDTANTRVKAMGENEQVALRTQMASVQAQRAQAEAALADLAQQQRQAQGRQQQLELELGELALTLTGFSRRQQDQQALVAQWTARLESDRQVLETSRNDLEQLSASSRRWVEEQSQLRRRLDQLQSEHDPLQRTLDRLGDRLVQATGEGERHREELARIEAGHAQLATEAKVAQERLAAARTRLEQTRADLEAERAQILADRTTQRRLEKERTEKARELDRLETQRQVWREAEGSRATQEVLGSGIQGVHGLISQLGRVEAQYQGALEVAAGNRLNNVVVEDDAVAAQAIELLKSRRAGRATFLPLNKLRSGRYLERLHEEGAIGYALDLIEFDRRYEAAFVQVFGDTVVFRSLELARRQLGRYRMVTMAGELLEKSGAMTGGSLDARRGGSGFALSEPPELAEMRARLGDLDRLLATLAERLERREQRAHELQSAAEAAQRELVAIENRAEQLGREHSTQQARATQLRVFLDSCQVGLEADRQEQADLAARLGPLREQIVQVREELAKLEQSDNHHRWQQSQQHLRELETEVRRWELQLRHAEADLQKSHLDEQLAQEKRQNLLSRRLDWEDQKVEFGQREEESRTRLAEFDRVIAELAAQVAELEERLVDIKRERDRLEAHGRALQQRQGQLNLQREQERLHQGQRAAALAAAQERLDELGPPAEDVPPPPEDLSLEQLQATRLRKQRRLEALEPVNMLAIEEYDRTAERQGELSEKLATLQRERSELLLRIEDCDTLKRSAFMQAFDAVNTHFQSLFAELSDGDGHLALEDPDNPFAGGLTLVAHPRGKQVRRLEAMSGGEKSLTALSFIFALQRYRPSPFYAFDEVDMFLDGANVERLAKMVRQQANSTQFLVVSLRRPMIERADRAIGVTLARAGHSQVLGVKLAADAS